MSTPAASNQTSGGVAMSGQGANGTVALLSDTLEEAVLRFGRGGASTIQAPLNELIQGGLQTWAMTAHVLKKLSINPEMDASEEQCWDMLGLSALHGPAPCTADIHARLRIGDLLSQLSEMPGWSAEDAMSAKVFNKRLHLAAQICIAKLPEALRHRKMLKTTPAVPRWQEPDPDFVVYLAEVALATERSAMIAVNLSNLHGLNLTQYSPIVKTPLECRPIYQQLYGNPAEIKTVINSFQGKNVTLWAPDNGRSLGQMLGVLDKMVKEGDGVFNLHFLVPFVPMPGIPNAEMINELWSHQMLSSKYNHIRKRVVYFLDPMRCAFSGNSAPLHHLKSLVMITMRSSGAPEAPTIQTFKREMIKHNIGRAVRVDVPEEHQRGVYIFLQSLQMTHCLGWEPGQKSPGSTATCKRSVLTGFFDDQKVSTLDMVGIVRTLRDMPQLHSAFIGPEAMFANPHALIMDLADTRVLHEIRDMLNEVVFVSPSRAIMDTQRTNIEWEDVLTHQHQQDPKSAIKSIRYRQGIFEGKVFAKPGVLAKFAYNERARHRLSRVPGEIRDREMLSTSLQISGLPHTQRAQIVQQIITQVQSEAGIFLVQRTGDVLEPGEWCMGGDSREGGEIQLLLRSPEEHVKLLTHMHGAGMDINGHRLAIEVQSIQQLQFAGRDCKCFVGASQADAGTASSTVQIGGGASSS